MWSGGWGTGMRMTVCGGGGGGGGGAQILQVLRKGKVYNFGLTIRGL